MKKYFIFFFLTLSSIAFSQTLDSLEKVFHKKEAPSLNADRPGATYSAVTVGEGALLTQWGVEFGGHSLAKWNAESSSFKGLLDLRYGIGEKLEIGSFINTYQNNITLDTLKFEQRNSSYSLNLRYTVLNSNGFALGFLADAAYTNDKKAGDSWLYSVKALSGIALGDVFSLSSNLGYNYSGGSSWANYTFNVGAALFNDFGIYAEAYGNVGPDVNEVWLDGGLWFLAGPNVQLDAFFAKGFNNNVQDLIVSVGVSWRLIEPKS